MTLLEPVQVWIDSFPVLENYSGIIIFILRVIILVIVAKLLMRLGNALIGNLFSVEQTRFKMESRKAKTLDALLKSVLRYAIYFLVGMAIIDALGVPTSSIIASAGIVGLAVGFGAQGLVKDVLTGFFILFEDQFSVGDYVETAGLSGVVEEVGLRVTKLRDFSGVLHIIPNGAIDKVTNHNRGNMRAMVDVSVAYEEDPDVVRSVLDIVASEMAADTLTIVEGPRVLGIADLTESAIVFRVWARTLPMEQWGVERELRRRIKLAFDREGIEIPYPRRVIISKNEIKQED
ncbi:MAG: small conductance mechanosensitive channel [Bacillota bacterium]|nr:MAG: small conductance mechanosensitive channel [Bacillota bacterium]MBS3951049.1 mechanosensitive ion channel family protein [Peptococcaceae bacterium]